MIKPVHIRILFLFLLVFLMGPIYAERIYGGHYTAERLANVRRNCEKYEWARQKRALAVEKAKLWVSKSDEQLWLMIPGQDLPRTTNVTYDGLTKGPKFLGCVVCGDKISQYGRHPYDPDFENKPWKLTCPSCKSVFPTNDFGKFYESAIDEHGLFDPTKGDTSLLFNTDHPDPKDPLHKFGVDDGYGYIDENGRAHKYIGYYTWKYWDYINGGLAALANAFIYTGDQRYAHKAAIMLDRIADVYPDMDWKPYADRGWLHSDGGGKMGKIEGSIWEAVGAREFANSYDMILSGTQNDPNLYSFLRKQSRQYKLPTAKGNRALFLENVDKRLLKTAFEAVLSKQIRGNQGMHQLTVAACAIALNTEPLTTEWLDWLFLPEGGAIPGLMISKLDRDGTSDEGAPKYALMWGQLMTNLAGLLADYSGYDKHDIFRDFPQFRATFLAGYKMAALGMATPNVGDYGSTGLVATLANPEFMAKGYFYTGDPEIAVAAYRANGNSGKGLGLDIFSENPERIGQEIQRIGEKAGARPEGGYLMSGFGLAFLELGKDSSGMAIANNYGRTIMHAHPDLLNFDLFAFGNWLAPDHGYPEFATKIPNRMEWTGSTISHNVVFVNQKPQQPVWGGHTKLFKQLKGFGVFEVDGKKAYPETDKYERTLFLIGGSDSNNVQDEAYVVDIFQVKGGYDHVYSFHGPPGDITTSGLHLRAQDKGSYAGEAIPKGTPTDGSFPVGYSFLYNVRRDQWPPAQFMLDWKVEGGYHSIKDKEDVHLRMHMLSPSNEVALADGDPPQNKPGNPKKLGYMLMHRAGKDLGSTFVSVLEPYRGKPFIRSVERLEKGAGDAVALKIEKLDGSIDYVLYNPVEGNTVLVNDIAMNGRAAYLREEGNRVKKGILVNGTHLSYKDVELKSAGKIKGKVVKMNKELDGGAWLLVDSKSPMDASLIGEQIIIDTNTDRDATYTIHQVEQVGELTKIICGPISFVRNFKGGEMQGHTTRVPKFYTKGYLYDFEEGASFEISSHAVWASK